MPNVVFLNFGAEPESAVGSIQELRTDYSKIDNFKLDETGGDFSKRVVTRWKKEKLRRKTKSPFSTVFFQIFVL